MPTLPELQRLFAATMFDASANAVQAHVEAGSLLPAERLDIYRNNVFSNYRKALQDTYPTIGRLVGDEFFNAAARVYIQRTEARSGDLNDYGEDFAEFLQGFAPARDLAYLPDMARLEWHMHRVFHAADPDPVDLSHLVTLKEDEFGRIRCALLPTARLFSSAYPVVRIWQVSQPGADDADNVSLDEGSQQVLICRRGYQVELRRLDPPEYTLLEKFSQGHTLAQALESTCIADSDLDLADFLQRHLLTPSLKLMP